MSRDMTAGYLIETDTWIVWMESVLNMTDII